MRLSPDPRAFPSRGHRQQAHGTLVTEEPDLPTSRPTLSRIRVRRSPTGTAGGGGPRPDPRDGTSVWGGTAVAAVGGRAPDVPVSWDPTPAGADLCPRHSDPGDGQQAGGLSHPLPASMSGLPGHHHTQGKLGEDTPEAEGAPQGRGSHTMVGGVRSLALTHEQVGQARGTCSASDRGLGALHGGF